MHVCVFLRASVTVSLKVFLHFIELFECVMVKKGIVGSSKCKVYN